MTSQEWLVLIVVGAAVFGALKLNQIAARVDDIEHRLRHLHPIGKDERQECEAETELLDEGDPVVRTEMRKKLWKTKIRD